MHNDSPGKAQGLTPKECSIKCPVCPFTASSAISFRNHLNTHSRDCLKCGLRFLTPVDVQQHVQQHHDNDLRECIYDPDMADQLEDVALRNAVHVTPPASSSGERDDVEPDLEAAALYSQDSGGGVDSGRSEHDAATADVSLLMQHNYMMVVNDANQVEIHTSDGTVVGGIVSEDGQVYTTQDVTVEQLIKKEVVYSNGDDDGAMVEEVSVTTGT